MRIETAHKILIGSAILFFLIYALFEFSRWRAGDGAALLRSGAGVAAAAFFALYLRSYLKAQKSR